jgi:hypothetical protein
MIYFLSLIIAFAVVDGMVDHTIAWWSEPLSHLLTVEHDLLLSSGFIIITLSTSVC